MKQSTVVVATLGSLLAIWTLGPPAALANEPELATIEATWTDEAPKIDGLLDDACWQQAPPIKSFWTVDGDQRHDHLAWAKVAYDPTHLYIAFHLRADQNSGIPGGSELRDQAVWGGNCVQIFVQPAGQPAYHDFVVNSRNTQHDGRDADPGWNVDWPSAVHIAPDKSFCRFELAIPYACFYLGAAGKDWRFNPTCVVVVGGKRYLLTWAPAFSSFHNPKAFGHLKLPKVDWQKWRSSLRVTPMPDDDGTFNVVVDPWAPRRTPPTQGTINVVAMAPDGRQTRRSQRVALPRGSGGIPVAFKIPITVEGDYGFDVSMSLDDDPKVVAQRIARASTPPAFEAWTSRSLYAAQAEAMVRVKTSRRQMAGLPCRLVVTDQAGAAVATPVEAKFQSDSLTAQGAIDIRNLPVGRYTISVLVNQVKGNGEPHHVAKCDLVKVQPQPGTVYYDDRGVLHRDGQTIFPIGMYYIYSEMGNQKLREEFIASGFNTVQWEWVPRQFYAKYLADLVIHFTLVAQ